MHLAPITLISGPALLPRKDGADSGLLSFTTREEEAKGLNKGERDYRIPLLCTFLSTGSCRWLRRGTGRVGAAVISEALDVLGLLLGQGKAGEEALRLAKKINK